MENSENEHGGHEIRTKSHRKSNRKHRFPLISVNSVDLFMDSTDFFGFPLIPWVSVDSADFHGLHGWISEDSVDFHGFHFYGFQHNPKKNPQKESSKSHSVPDVDASRCAHEIAMTPKCEIGTFRVIFIS